MGKTQLEAKNNLKVYILFKNYDFFQKVQDSFSMKCLEIKYAVSSLTAVPFLPNQRKKTDNKYNQHPRTAMATFSSSFKLFFFLNSICCDHVTSIKRGSGAEQEYSLSKAKVKHD